MRIKVYFSHLTVGRIGTIAIPINLYNMYDIERNITIWFVRSYVAFGVFDRSNCSGYRHRINIPMHILLYLYSAFSHFMIFAYSTV